MSAVLQPLAVADEVGRWETFKWLAFAVMVWEHVSQWLLAQPVEVAWLSSRMVFPAFALLVGRCLFASSGQKALERGTALVMLAALASLPFFYLVGDYILNCLWLFGAAYLLKAAVWRGAYFSEHKAVDLVGACGSGCGPIAVVHLTYVESGTVKRGARMAQGYFWGQHCDRHLGDRLGSSELRQI